MKILTVKSALVAAAALLSGTSTMAVTLSFGDSLTLDTGGVVGTVLDGEPFGSVANQAPDYLSFLLSLGASQTDIPHTSPAPPANNDHTYSTGINDYNASSLTLATVPGEGGSGDTTIPAGYQFALIKYGGGRNNNGGLLALFLNGQGATIPDQLQTVFGADKGGGLSGFLLFNSTDNTLNGQPIPPEGTPGAVPDGGATLLLLGGGISALALLRRKLS